MNILDSTGLSYLISKIKAAFWSKSETTQVAVDATPTASSNNLVKSGGVYSALAGKVDTATLTDYPKYYLCADEAEYTAITNKDAGTLYLIPES